MRDARKGNLFNKGEFRDLCRDQIRNVSAEIAQIPPEEILATDESALVAALVRRYRLDVPVLHPEGTGIIDRKETEIPTDDYGRTILRRGTTLTIAVPFEGDGRVLGYVPAARKLVAIEGIVREQEILLEFAFTDRDHGRVAEDQKGAIETIKEYLETMRSEAEEYHKQLAGSVETNVRARRARFQREDTLIESLGIPLRLRSTDRPAFVPLKKRRPVPIEPPAASPGTADSAPIIRDADYEQILRIMSSMAVAMERSPRTFTKLDEEEIRDFFVVALNGHYEGMATGETFNGEGKTDILIRYQNRNVFIGECKFWQGPEAFTAAISQLFDHYVTWRDTKVALVIFNKNVNHSAVLAKIDGTVREHQYFRAPLPKTGESDMRYVFRLPSDANRNVYVAVLAFHIPPALS